MTAPPLTPPRKRTVIVCAVLAAVAAALAAVALLAHDPLRAARAALDRRDFPTARAELAEHLSARPDDAETALLHARALWLSGDLPGGADALAAARRRHPRDAALAREARLFQARQGDPRLIDELLAECFERDTGADPAALEAAVSGGTAVLMTAFARGGTERPAVSAERVRRGVELWLRARTGPADQTAGRVWRGLCAVAANDERQAAADFRAVLAADPDHRDARLYLALALSGDDPAAAAELIAPLWARAPNDHQAASALARAYRNAGRIADADRVLGAVLAANPDLVGALTDRGELALDRGDFAAAERDLSRAVRLAPDNPKATFALASALRGTGRTAEAAALVDRYRREAEARLRPPQ